MFITNDLALTKKKDDNRFVIHYSTEKKEYLTTDTFYEMIDKLYNVIRTATPSVRKGYADQLINEIFNKCETAETESEPLTPKTTEEILIETLNKLVSFFTEFQFEPNFRFLNSLVLQLNQSVTKAKDYLTQYFELIDSPYSKEVREKIKSAEFKTILDNLKLATPSTTINNRFKLYYGSQGTGKTTIAMKETSNRCMVCNSSMLPADIMEDFVFVDGKATFQPSALWNCMVKGEKIVLDELNLLPFDTLRFLQTILDGKKEFLYKGNRIEIADGFQIIGTMNLVVNGMTYGLPEPLVDRCAETRKFGLTAKDLLTAIM